MKKLFALMMALIMTLCLCACGGGGGDAAAEDPNLGMYTCVGTSISGMDMGVDGEWIELKSGGKVDVFLLGVEVDGTYTLEGEAITFELDGETAGGTLVDGVMTIDFWGMECVYEKDAG